jgi:hypothetical protein
LTFDPYAEIACWAWSSEKIKMIFGRSAACRVWQATEKTKTAAQRSFCIVMGLSKLVGLESIAECVRKVSAARL